MSKRKASSTSLSTLRSDPRSPHHANMTQIDPNGNLCMTFPSSTNAPSQSLLVSHHILCLSSKVFKEMLNPYTPWRAKSQPRCIPDPIDTVEFPDDDYASMLIVMNVLHMQHQRVPLKVDIEQLYKLAMLCDKYDLVQSMGLWPEKWTQRFAANVETVGYHGLLLIAHVFRHEEIFAQISRYLILNSKIDLDTGELVTVKGVPFTEGVPDAIIGTLNDHHLPLCENDAKDVPQRKSKPPAPTPSSPSSPPSTPATTASATPTPPRASANTTAIKARTRTSPARNATLGISAAWYRSFQICRDAGTPGWRRGG